METGVVICEGQEFDVGINQNTASDLECAKLCWDSDDCVAWTRHQVRMAQCTICGDMSQCHLTQFKAGWGNFCSVYYKNLMKLQEGWCCPVTRADCKSPEQGWSWGTKECGFHQNYGNH